MNQEELQKLREKVVKQYLTRLEGLFYTGFTGNITINCKKGFPMNHNVNYTKFLDRETREKVESLLKQTKQEKEEHYGSEERNYH